MARFLIGLLKCKKSIHWLRHSIGCENLADVIMIPCGPGPDMTLANKATLTRVQYAGQIEPKYKLFYGVRSRIAQESKQWIYKKHFKTGYRYLSSQLSFIKPEFNSIDALVDAKSAYIVLVKFKHKPRDINKHLQPRFAIQFGFVCNFKIIKWYSTTNRGVAGLNFKTSRNVRKEG